MVQPDIENVDHISSIRSWIRNALLNLVIVAGLGLVMRYKIAYSLPFIDQKNFLHAHSHFAFSGWITQALMILLIGNLSKCAGTKIILRYKWVLLLNLIAAYGMLFSFPFQGYGIISTTFSTFSIFVSYAFGIMYWKDLNELPGYKMSSLWFKAALVFNGLSSLGPFSLAIMMATKTIHQNWYLESIYFYLHFQYNGWFFFACMGLLIEKLDPLNVFAKKYKIIFNMFLFACVPAYFLSVLWLTLPTGIFIIVLVSALIQVVALFLNVQILIVTKSFNRITNPVTRKLFILAGIALSIKILLQLVSIIPSISHLAFGFRPIVIAYLHLVLLGVFTIFILGYIVSENYIDINKKMIIGMVIFIGGIILNEIVLMSQGIADLFYVYLPYSNQSLLIAAAILFCGILLINFSQKKKFRI